jgi:hypothetical protein
MQCDACRSENVILTTREAAFERSNNRWPWIWYCTDCAAYVGCHVGTHEPLGKLARGHMRYLRLEAHRAMDVIWRSGLMSRDRCYRWLGEQLETEERIHIGMLSCAQLKKAIEICNKYTTKHAHKMDRKRASLNRKLNRRVEKSNARR